MKKRMLYAMMGVMMVLVLERGTVLAGEVTADVNADVSVLSNYVWRGQNLGEDGVIQPNLSIGFANGLSLGVWANYLIDDGRYSDNNMVSEVDYTVDYSFELGPVGMSAGWIFYDFPRTGGSNTHELYLGASLDIILAPSLTVYRDINDYDGTYVNVGIGHDFEINDKATLSLSGTLGWGSESYHSGYFGVKDDSLSDYNLGASLAYAVTDKITITPMLNFSAFVDDDIEDAAEILYDENQVIYGGINVSYSF
jgi:uncharacterized protein (TIGR02001 family)